MQNIKSPIRKAKPLRLFLVFSLVFCILFFVSLKVQPVKAETDSYNLTDLPNGVADYFGIDVFSAEILVSALFLLFTTMLCGVAFYKSQNSAVLYAVLVVDFVSMGFLVALGWLPYWIFLMVCLLVAILLAMQLRGMITGEG